MIEFEPCSCGRHGCFITAASRKEVASKEDARIFLNKAFLRDVIGPSLCGDLLVKIGTSRLPERDESADPVVLAAVRDWNLQLAATNNPQAFLASRPKTCLVQALAS